MTLICIKPMRGSKLQKTTAPDHSYLFFREADAACRTLEGRLGTHFPTHHSLGCPCQFQEKALMASENITLLELLLHQFKIMLN